MRKIVLTCIIAGIAFLVARTAYADLVLSSSRTIDCGGDDFVRSVDADSFGNIYAAGEIRGRGDIWLAKYDASLVLMASATFNGSANAGDYGYDIKVGRDGYIYVGGEINNAGNIWLAKYDANLRLVTSTAFSGGTVNTCNGIALDRQGNVYATGKVGSETSCDIWIARFNSSLVLAASATVSGPVQSHSVDEGFGITVDEADNIYVTGAIGGPSSDIWLGKFNTSLILTGSRQFNCEGNDTDKGYRVAVFGGQVYVAGFMEIRDCPHFWAGRFSASDLILLSSMTYVNPGRSEIAGGIDIDGNGTVFITGRVYDNGSRIWFGRCDSSMVLQSSATFGSGSGLAVTVKTSEHRNTAWLGGNVTNAGQQDLWMGKYVENMVPPSAPVNFASRAVSAGTALFSWEDTSDCENGFRLYGAAGNLISELPENTTSFFLNGLAPDTLTPVREIRAFNELGESAAVNLSPVCYKLSAAPLRVFLSSRTTESLAFQWEANGASLFRIDLSTDNVHWSVAGDNVSDTAYRVGSLSRSKRYYARVWSYNHDHRLSADNAWLATMTEPAEPPEQPSGFRGEPLSASSILFSWQDNSEMEEGFRIYTATGGLSAELSANATSWILSGLAPNEASAVWSVRSFNFGFESSGVALSSPCYSLINAPLNFSVFERSTGSITVQWTDNGASGYRVNWSSDAVNWDSMDCLDSVQYLCGGLQPASTCYFRVWAYNGAHILSSNPSYLTAVTDALLMEAAAPPLSFAAIALSSASIHYTWQDASTDEEGFRIYTSSGGLLVQLAPDTTDWIHAGLAPDTVSAAHDIRSYNGAGESAPVFLASSCYTFADIPRDLYVSSATSRCIALQWSSSGVAFFRVFCSTDGSYWAAMGEPLENAISLNDLFPATTYHIRVFAVNHNGVASDPAVISSVTDASASLLFDPVQGDHTITCATGRGEISVYVPQGTLGEEMSVEIHPDAGENPFDTSEAVIRTANEHLALGGQVVLSGTITEFAVYDAVGHRITSPFARPVTVRIPYPDADHDGVVDGVTPPIQATDLRVFVLNEGSGQWEYVGGNVDTAACAVSVAVTHFSVYALAGRPSAAPPATVTACAYPNPFYPARHGSMTIGSVPVGTRARLYTIAGEFVRQLTDDVVPGKIIWDGRNESGAAAASGVYIAFIKGDGLTKKVKIAVIR